MPYHLSKSHWRFIWLILQILLYVEYGKCFDVYWNVPTQSCQRFGIYVNASSYGIVQNSGDIFYGDKVYIYYTAGAFPYLKDGVPIHGGIPQNGSLIHHVEVFKDQVNTKLPRDFNGVAVLDFESYYPSYDMSVPEYKKASDLWISSKHPDWSPERVQAESERTFNNSAREFFETLLWTGRELRPRALWGYYHYPYCHNYGPDAMSCKPEVMAHNDDMLWLIKGSNALYPSIYIFKNSGWSPRTRRRNAQVRMKEALRVRRNAQNDIPILPYSWYRYHDTAEYLSPMDLTNTLGLAKIMGVEGIVIWGANHDLDTQEKCSYFKNYLEEKLGPIVLYIKHFNRRFLRHILRSKKLLKKFSRSAMREASLGMSSNDL